MMRTLVKLPVPSDVFDWIHDEVVRRGQGDRVMSPAGHRATLLSLDEVALERMEQPISQED